MIERRPREPTTAWASEGDSAEPGMQIAENLESAGARTFVYVDDSGRVRPAWRYRVLQIASWTVLGVLWLASAALLIAFTGLFGLLLAAVLAAVVAHLALLSSWIHRGVILLAHDRLDDADRLLTLATRYSLLHFGARALALQNRSAVAQRRAEHDAALAFARRALALRERIPFLQSGLHYWLLRYTEVILLCNVNRFQEAAEHLATIQNAPAGEYITLRRWTAELYVALCTGRLQLSEHELELCSDRAAAIPTSPELAALCAWAWSALGRADRAERLLELARVRCDLAPFADSLPRLADWMNVSENAAEIRDA